MKIQNVRCFRDVDLEFTRAAGSGCTGWTVIVGRNGSGKTTLLQSIALGCLGGLGEPPGIVGGAWGRRGAPAASQTWQLVRDQDDSFPGADVIESSTQSEEQTAFYRRFLDEITRAGSLSIRWPLTPLDDLLLNPSITVLEDRVRTNIVRATLASPQSLSWFACAYGAFRRRAGQTPDLTQALRAHPRVAALAPLFSEELALVECTEWLRDVHFRAIDKDDASLRALRDDALRLLNDGLLPDGFVLSRVDSDGLWARRGGGEESHFDNLSSGFRVVASLVLDMISRMHRAFSGLRVETDGDHLVVPHSGVVLIDEAEEHLHPAWQQRLGFWFKRHFPNVQFIVTTHSPFICQAADLLIHLHPDGSDAWTASRASEKTYAAVVHGTIDDAVMSDLFGVERIYTERTERLRDELAALEVKVIRGAASPDEVRRHAELAAQLPSNDTSTIEQSLRKLVKMR